MPTATGRLELQDYDAALVAEGFDGFLQSERYLAINLGYREIARYFPFSWEITSATYTIDPAGTFPNGFIDFGAGSMGGGIWTGGSFDIRGSRTQAPKPTPEMIREVYLLTDPYRRKLSPLSEDEFMENWFYLDLTAAKNRGIPESYYFWNGDLYILPPPQSAMQILVWFNQFLPDMVNVTDTPVTPQAYDEAILDAARVRMHRRAKELTLAADAQARVDRALEDMIQDEAFSNWDEDERVRPDDQWL